MIAATFHGPNHWSPNHDESTIEVFENIGHAISALFDRYDDKGSRPLPVRYLNGNHGNFIFRGIELGDSFECYEVIGTLPVDDQPVEDGMVLEALSAVHLGVTDYVLTLMPPFGHETAGSVAVSVARREYRSLPAETQG